MNYHLFNNLVKEFPTNLRRFILRRLRRFNCLPRAHKVIDKISADKAERAPLPERIQKRVEEVLKNEPELLKTISSERNETLLERLKKVFVKSFGENKDMFNKTRLTPIQYNLFQPDKIQEYNETIPEGKFSLQQAAIFLTEFQRNPSMGAVESLSEKLKLEPNTIMGMLTHTKVLKSVLPINKKSERSKSFLQNVEETLSPSIIETEPDEEKIYRILEKRNQKFTQYSREKLGLNDREYVYQVKNSGLRKVLTKFDIIQDTELSVKDANMNKSVTKIDEKVASDGVQREFLVSDLKPGEDPDAPEKFPPEPSHPTDTIGEFPHPDQLFSRHESASRIIHTPEDDKFDVFEVMKKQDKAKKAKTAEEIDQKEIVGESEEEKTYEKSENESQKRSSGST